MKKFKIFAMLLSLACATGFVACDDDEVVKQELQSPSVSGTFSNYQSLDLEWSAVENTIQYGYKLFNPQGDVVNAGVTKSTAAKFSGLQPATTYTLKVWAFAGLDTDYSTSPAAELTATTAALVKLATPTNLTVTDNGGSMTASWDAVENALSYSYSISAAEGGVVDSGTVKTTSLRISGLEEGDYSISVTATTTEGGYISSDQATCSFRFVKPVSSYLWKATGTYYSGILGKSWEVTLLANSDGSYTIPAFYGVEGYDLSFIVDEDLKISILSGSNEYEGYSTVATGVSSIGDIYVYLDDNYYTGFEGSADGGDLWLSYYDQEWSGWYEVGNNPSGDSFNWTGSTSRDDSTSLTIDDLVGSYSSYFQGYDGLGDEDVDADYEWYGAEITKVDDNTVAISNLYWEGYPVNGTVDFDNMTITLDPQVCGSYTFASVDGVDKPVIATINGDGSIFLPHVSYWYCWDPDWYYYSDLNITLTKISGTRSNMHKTVAQKAPQKKVKRATRK